MSDDEKKALIVAGGIAVIGLAIWLSRGMNIIPAGASGIQPTTNLPPGPGYTTYNIPPYGGSAVSSIYPPVNDNLGGVSGGCCSGNDGCFTAGGINTGNAPTSLTQLLNWYQNGGSQFTANFASSMKAFNIPPSTLAEQTAPPLSNVSNVPF